MGGAKKAQAYRVIGALAVIRKDGHERYVDHGGIVSANQLDEDNAKHLLNVGLIEAFEVAGDGGEEPYKGVKVEDLKADIAKRNEGREDSAKISDAGNRAELVAALVADDNK